MKFGGLSESEVSNISFILNNEGIPFSVGVDQEIEEFNTASMKNNLRHYTPPNISTHILAITIEDEDFSKISHSGKSLLLGLGITDEAPAPEDFSPSTGKSIHQDLIAGPRRMLASNFVHQLIFGFVMLLLFFFFKNFN